MADLPKRVWNGKKQVYSGKKPVWVKDGKLGVYDPNFEEVNNGQYYSPNRWGNLSSDVELQVYDDKDSLNPTDIGTFEDGLEATYQFIDYNSTVLKSGTVKDGETPVAPSDPTRESYTFTGWNPAVGPITKNTNYSAEYAQTYSSFDAMKIREALTGKLKDVDVMMMSGRRKCVYAYHYDFLAGGEGFSMGGEYGEGEVFVAVQTNVKRDILGIAVKTQEELGMETYNQLRDAFMGNMTDEIWAMVQGWFSTTLTVTTSGGEITISDGGQSIIINTTTHAMRYGTDYYDWTSDTSTEYTTIETNGWLVDGTYTYQGVNQDWNTIIDSIKAKGIVNATITHDAVNGEITMANGQWSFTIMDKNLGATQVYEDGDTLSEANCGKYYQRGNNYGFDGIGGNNPVFSSTKVDTTGYGPGNYYTGTDFIGGYGVYDWSNPSNNNLWGDTTDTDQARQGPCPSGYHVPSIDELRNFIQMYKAIRPNVSEGVEFFRDFKFCTSGYRSYYNGNIDDTDTRLRLWSSSIGIESPYAMSLNVYIGGGEIFRFDTRSKTQAPSIRPFKNSPSN